MSTFYHNPRCSKSRQALTLLEDNGKTVEIKEYLKMGLEESEVFHILDHFEGDVKSLIRRKEKVMAEVSIDWEDRKTIATALVEYPILLERPILVEGKKVLLGRPPENILG